MTIEQIKAVKRQIDGKRPRPRVYAVLNDGVVRRVLSMGNGWVRVYVRNEKTRIGANRIVSIQVESRDGVRMSQIN